MPQPTTPPQHFTNEEREARRQEQIERNQALVALLDEWAQGDQATPQTVSDAQDRWREVRVWALS